MKVTLYIALIFMSNMALSQFPGCPDVDAGADQILDCLTPCTDLTAIPFDAGATTGYSVASIPATPPIAFNAPGGNPVSVGIDDVWSSAIQLPFNFCFYGQTYTNCVVGSNGCIQFGTANAGGFQPWSFSATVPSPLLTDAGNIFGPYHDIDPSVSGTVNWYLLGTAPCRIFVVSFNQIAHFSCTTLNSTHMMVLYETTNAIDVYIDNKATCATWNSGNTVVGIQNMAGTLGITPPARNTGPWTVIVPEAWRFLPNGAPIYTVDWLEGTSVIGTGTTVNVCPTVPTTYTARATYLSCDGSVIIEEDDVLVSPANTGMTLDTINFVEASCGAADGSVEITATGGTPGYTFSDDNITYQSSGIFTGLAAGNYTFFAQDTLGCISPIFVEMVENSTLSLNFNSVSNVSCNGANDGSISVIATGGAGPYAYSLNAAPPVGTGDFFPLMSGSYSIEVTDINNCSFTVDTVIIEPTPLSIAEVSTVNESCNLSNGELVVSSAGGTSPYLFSIDGGITTQSSGSFTGLPSGTYTVQVQDSSLCINTVDVTVLENASPTISLVTYTDEICPGSNSGTVELSTSGGTMPYTYFIDGSNPQVNPIFNNLGLGTFEFSVEDSNSCVDQISVTINEIPAPSIFNSDIGCNFSYWVTGTTSPVGGTWSSADTAISFLPSTSVENPQIITSTPGVYTVSYTDSLCQITETATIDFPPYPWTWLSDTTLCNGVILNLTAIDENNYPTNYEWNTGQLGQSISISEPGIYTVTVSNICHSGQNSIEVDYKLCDIIAPNVISIAPGSQNPLWYVEAEGLSTFNLTITNRWGNVVYSCSDNKAKCYWDGTSQNGAFVEEGTYYYIIDATLEGGQELQKHGFIEVVD